MTLDQTRNTGTEWDNGEKKNPLVKMITCGNVRLSIFENGGRQYNDTVYFAVKVSRSYRDAQGTWQYTSSFYKSHLPQLIHACQRALAFVEEAESEPSDPPPF